MDTILIHLLVGLIVFGIIFAVVGAAQRAAWIDPSVARIAMIVVGGIFLIWLLIDILLPLIHTGPLLRSP
jgi:hypothetical protein